MDVLCLFNNLQINFIFGFVVKNFINFEGILVKLVGYFVFVNKIFLKNFSNKDQDSFNGKFYNI